MITRTILGRSESPSYNNRSIRESKSIEEPNDGAEYTIHKLVGHELHNDGINMYRVRWYRYGAYDDK